MLPMNEFFTCSWSNLSLLNNLLRGPLPWVLYAGHVPINELCEALSIEPESEELNSEAVCDLEDIMRHCRSLFRLSTNDHLESPHLTVVEFFEGTRLQNHDRLKSFWISRVSANLSMASTCLRYLNLKNFRRAIPSSPKDRLA